MEVNNMCIHADYSEKKCKWIPSVKIEDHDDSQIIICEKCGRRFTQLEFFKLVQIIDPNSDVSFTHCFGRLDAPLKSTIAARLKVDDLD